MVSLSSQLGEVEASLRRLQRRIPELPVAQMLASRTLMLLGRELSHLFDQRLRPHGLSEAEFRTLILVYASGDDGAYPGELGVSLCQSPANITRITETLVERGLISRVADEHDRRRLLLSITAGGEQLVQSLLPLMTASVRSTYQQFAAADLEQLLGALQQVARAIDESQTRPTMAPPGDAVG